MSAAEGSKIRMLSTHVANKIAAGEVVERPASVVKELLENALDAGATRMDVVVTAGGRKLVSVSDDGSGMNRDDAIMAPERQATSKIREVDDIEHIATMGFRGEALASIASVSRFTLSTRRPSDAFGTEVSIAGGKMLDVKDCGCPPGTCIEVRDLFFNVPARRNFLRSFQTEQAHIRNVFIIHAIANPGIAMSLKCDGDVSYQLAAADSLHDRLLDIIGHEEMERLVPVDMTLGVVHVHGYAGIPSWTRGDRNGQHVYINRRPATAPAIQNAIHEAYPKLEEARRPIVYLFIDLPPEQVDVNVHPTKREVRFRCISDVRDAVIAALASALNRSGAPMPAVSPPVSSFPQTFGSATPPQYPGNAQNAFVPSTSAPFRMPSSDIVPSASPPMRPAPAFPFDSPSAQTFGGAQYAPTPAPAETFEGVTVEMPSGAPWSRFRVIGRLSTGYAVLETNDGYTILDPAAAHERVLYEKLLGLSGHSQHISQRLLIPQSVELKPLDFRRIETVLPILKEMGFGIEPFGKDAFMVDAIPDVISGASCEAVLLDTATALEEAGGNKRGKDRWREELIAKSASRAAVRTRGALSPKALNSIIIELAGCEMPYTSPSGRPTMIFTSFRELDRRFGKN